MVLNFILRFLHTYSDYTVDPAYLEFGIHRSTYFFDISVELKCAYPLIYFVFHRAFINI